MSFPAMPIFYLVLLTLHFVGLALGVGASFALLTLRKTAAHLEPAERTKFLLRADRVHKHTRESMEATLEKIEKLLASA